jgi:hypothetical protein
MTWVTGAAITAAQLNAHLRDNMLETATAKASTAGSYLGVTGANALAERIMSYDYVSTSETTTSTSATDLATTGPSVTVTASARALVFMTAAIFNNTVNATSAMAVDLSGATTVAASSSVALRAVASTANAGIHASIAIPYSVTSGSNVFTAKYFCSSGSTATYQYRRMIVLPW